MDIQGEDFCAVTGLNYTKFSSGIEKIVATCSNRFYVLNGTSSWDLVEPGVQITSGQDNQFVWTVALDNVVGVNDVDAPILYDGTNLSNVDFSTLSASETPSTAKTVAFFKNYLIFFNTVENSVERPTRSPYRS